MKVVNIQEVEFTIASGASSGTGSLSGFSTLSKIVPMFATWRVADGQSPVEASNVYVNFKIDSTSQITAERYSNPNYLVTCRAFVIEFGSDTTVYKGTWSMSDSDTSDTAISIGATVTLSNTFGFHYRMGDNTPSGSGDINPDGTHTRMKFSSTSQIEINRNTANEEMSGNWYVITSSTLSVQHDSYSYTGANTTETDTISSVTLAETFIISGHTTDETRYNDESCWVTDLSSATTIRFRRSYAGNNTHVWDYMVVSDSDFSVQRGDYTTSGTTDNKTVSTIDTDLSIVKTGSSVCGESSSEDYNDGDLIGRYSEHWIDDSTQINRQAGLSIGDYIETYETVEFAEAASGDISGEAELTILASGDLKGKSSLQGDTDLNIDASGNLKGKTSLQGDTGLTVNTSGNLKSKTALSGSANLNISGSGDLKGKSSLQGNTDFSINQSGILKCLVSLSGNTDLNINTSGDLKRLSRLSGSTSFSVDGAGNLKRLYSLSGSTSLNIQSVANLKGKIALSGNTNLNIDGAGNLKSFAILSGGSQLTILASGNLNTSEGAYISGSANLTINASGSLKAKTALSGSANLNISGSGSLKSKIKLSGNSDLNISGSANLKNRSKLSGSSIITIGASGGLKARTKLAGSTGFVITASGALFEPGSRISGTANLNIDTSGNLKGKTALSGNSNLSISGAGSLKNKVALSGSSTLTFSASSNLITRVSLGGNSDFSLDSSGNLKRRSILNGSTNLIVNGAGNINLISKLSGVTNLSIITTGSLSTGGLPMSGSADLSIIGYGNLRKKLVLRGESNFTIAGYGNITRRYRTFIIGKGLYIMSKKSIFNFDYPQRLFLPKIEINQGSTAEGDITIKNKNITQINTITSKVYRVSPPNSDSTEWQTIGSELSEDNPSIISLSSYLSSSGFNVVKYSIDVANIPAIEDNQYFAVMLFVNESDNADISQAQIDLIIKVNDMIHIN